MTQSTADMLYDQLRNTARLLDEVWEAIDSDGQECERCEGLGLTAEDEDSGTDCPDCDGTGELTGTYEDSNAREYLDEMPLEIVWEKGEPFAVVLGTGGPHVEIRGGTRHDGSGYALHGYWSGEHVTVGGEGVTRTGEYFREIVEEQDISNARYAGSNYMD